MVFTSIGGMGLHRRLPLIEGADCTQTSSVGGNVLQVAADNLASLCSQTRRWDRAESRGPFRGAGILFRIRCRQPNYRRLSPQTVIIQKGLTLCPIWGKTLDDEVTPRVHSSFLVFHPDFAAMLTSTTPSRSAFGCRVINAH